MKKAIVLVITLCMCFTALSGTAFAEPAATETQAAEGTAAEGTAAEMTAEELLQAGEDALDAEDYGKAMECFQLAADAGRAEGWRSIGYLYDRGQGVEQSYEKAMEYYLTAADLGDAKAMYNIGAMYISGEGADADFDKAMEWLQRAADHGFAEAFSAMAILYFYGAGVEQDTRKAAECYQKAAELGYTAAYYDLGVMYLYGTGGERDLGKAAEYFQQAADLGDEQTIQNAAEAFCDLGTAYYIGEGTEKDTGKAAEYYQKAADLGSTKAAVMLGSMFYDGIGTEQDYGKAYETWQRAAEQGDPTAMFGLGECCYEGKGTEKDPGKAAEWYRKALEAGYEPDGEDAEHLKAALGDEYSVFFPEAAEGADYTVRTAEVLTGKEQVGSMDLRFYPSAPHVPYYGLKAYVNFMYQTGLTVTPPEDGGVWEVTNPNGTKILVNPSAGTIEAADWAKFQIPPLPYTTLVGAKDSACGWTYYSDIVFDDPPAPVTFDFAKYGISVYADGEDVYLPLELLSSMFTDMACNCVLWNGEKVLKPEMNINSIGVIPVEWYEGEYMRGLLTGEKQRAKDVIREDYAELCFTMDYLYGYPGVTELEKIMREKGFDAALDDIPELVSIKNRLKDPDMIEYMLAFNDLINIGLNEGHCIYSGLNTFSEPDFPYPELLQKISGRMSSMYQLKAAALLIMREPVMKARKAAWGDDVYRECGSTAIIRIDGFADDRAGWEAYYAGKGEIPMDAVGITWTGLKRASENPAIKNILFDLSVNAGGSSDMLAYMIDLMFGDNVFRGYNVLTGQREHAIIHSDKNLDGVFDEKDEEVKYDFNYAVLTTRAAFSCGNLMPFVMQEHGAVLLGEPTGGGSCTVQCSTLTNAGEFMMSSWLWALRDAKGESVEPGCRTDLLIERIESGTPAADNPNGNPFVSSGDYTPYFDDVMLDRMINEWFEEQALAPAA